MDKDLHIEPTHRRAHTYIPESLLYGYDRQRFSKITKLLSSEGIDIRVLESIKLTYSRLFTVYHSLSTDEFETALHNLKWSISKEILCEIIEALKFPNESLISAYKHTLSDRQVYHSNLYSEKNAHSNVQDLLHSRGSLNLRRDIHYKIDMLYRRILERFKNLSKAFINFDTDCDGYLSYDEFYGGVSRVNNIFQEHEVSEIFKSLDITGKEYLTFEDFGYLETMKRSMSPPRKANSNKVSRSNTPYNVRSQNNIYRKLPSEVNPEYAYGLNPKQPETIKEILNNTYQKQYLDKLSEYQRQLEVKMKTSTVRNDPTIKSIQRNEAIKQKYMKRTLSERKWKMPKFARVESKMKGATSES